NHLISFRQNTSENSTNISVASSRVNTPIAHFSGKPVTLLKQHLGRPSSAPCFLAHPVTDSSHEAKTECDADEHKPATHSDTSDQHSSSPDVEQASCDSQTSGEKESNEESDNSKLVFDRKLLKECRIILEDEYDRALRQHGWRMEIPGDPLNLKSSLLPKRLSYSVKFPLQPTLPQPPKMKKQNVETFFQPCIKIPLSSFTIHPDFTSECYNMHRNYLIKKGLWNYASRDYSFAY
ncbi:unnamed protein product, partial [Trichobilharzia szidati]